MGFFLHSLVKTELCCMIFNIDYYDKGCFSILRFFIKALVCKIIQLIILEMNVFYCYV